MHFITDSLKRCRPGARGWPGLVRGNLSGAGRGAHPGRRIVFVNRYYAPDCSATSQMLTDLATALAHVGLDVRVIVSRQLYEDAGADLLRKDACGGVKVTRVWTTRFGRRRRLGRAIDYLSFHVFAALAAVRLARSGDVLVALTDPPLLSVTLSVVARLRRAHLVNWLQDIFPEVAMHLGIGGRVGAPLLQIAAHLRNRSLRQARINVVVGNRMAEMVAGFGAPGDRVRVVANWADGTCVHPVAECDNRLRHAWGLDGQFVVGYSGNLGCAHDLSTIVDAMVQLETDGCVERIGHNERSISFLFVGGGILHHRLKRDIARLDIRRVHFKPYQPRDRLAESLSVADVHLISLRPQLEGLVVPSKYYGVAAVGRPVIFIGAQDGEIARDVLATRGGHVVEKGDGRGLADAIRALRRDTEAANAMGARARENFEQRYDLPLAVKAWRETLQTVMR